MKLDNVETRVLRICDLWYVFQQPSVIYPKIIEIFEQRDNSLVLVDSYLFEKWFFEHDNNKLDYEIIELNFGCNGDSYISCVRGSFNG